MLRKQRVSVTTCMATSNLKNPALQSPSYQPGDAVGQSRIRYTSAVTNYSRTGCQASSRSIKESLAGDVRGGLKAPILLDEGKVSEGVSTASKGMYWRLQYQAHVVQCPSHMQTNADVMD